MGREGLFNRHWARCHLLSSTLETKCPSTRMWFQSQTVGGWSSKGVYDYDRDYRTLTKTASDVRITPALALVEAALLAEVRKPRAAGLVVPQPGFTEQPGK